MDCFVIIITFSPIYVLLLFPSVQRLPYRKNLKKSYVISGLHNRKYFIRKMIIAEITI